MVNVPAIDGSWSAFPTSIGTDGTFVTQPLSPGTYALEVKRRFGGGDGITPEGAFAMAGSTERHCAI